MKRLLLIVISCFTISALAQTIQKGIVMEYNGKGRKTPLQGVEINVRNASPDISDKNGEFTLQFISLMPGDRVNVLRIEKLGYEIFNKEAVDQWNLNPNTPFVIVMCRSDKFKKIRDNYEAKASENYNKQYKKEIANLNKLKEEGKIKDDEFRKSLQEIQGNYGKQLENLDNFIDNFSRIDLSELSEDEQRIIDLVEQGEFDKAIAEYDQMNPQNRYRNNKDNLAVAEITISRLEEMRESVLQQENELLELLSSQIETLKHSDNDDNLKKATEIYRSMLGLEISDSEWLVKAGDDIYDNFHDNNLAIAYYEKALDAVSNSETPNSSLASTICNKISKIYRQTGDTKNAAEYEQKAKDFKQ